RWSSWWCHRQRSSCGTRQGDLRVRHWCGRRARRRGSSSARAEIQSISLCAISALTFLEVTAQPFPQLQPSPQQPRLYRRNAEVQRISRFLGCETFHVSQDKYRPKTRWQALNGASQDVPQLGLRVLLLRVRAPIRDFTRERIFFGLDFFVQ